MNARFFAFSLLLSCAGTMLAAETCDLKIRFIDTFAAMRESTEGAKVADTIENKREGIAKKLDADGKKLEAKDKEVRAKGSTMSEAALKKEQAEMAQMQRALKANVEEGQETLKLDMQQATENLAHKVEKAVDAYVKIEKPDAIIDKTTGRVVYTSGKADITDVIKRQMDADYAASKPKVGGAAAKVGAQAVPAKAVPVKAVPVKAVPAKAAPAA
jgi:Skp family chaperone for outer membrane proteins